jgi:broad specificity phosphatase PhoE
MIIYIRHANDNQKHKHSKHKHDHKITKRGKYSAKKMIHELTEKYGYPTKIYFSPFVRCRETVAAFVSELYLKKTGEKKHFCFKCADDEKDVSNKINIELVCDSRLSRYFTRSNRKKPSVASSTLKLGVPIYEKKHGLIQRMDNYVESIKKEDHSNDVIWCVTHGIIYKKIASRLGIMTADRIDFLKYFAYEDKVINDKLIEQYKPPNTNDKITLLNTNDKITLLNTNDKII